MKVRLSSRFLSLSLGLMFLGPVQACFSGDIAPLSWTAEEHYQEARTQYLRGDYQGALENAKAAILKDPNHWGAYQAAGYASYKLGDTTATINYCRRSLELNPNNPSLRDFLGKISPQDVPAQPSVQPSNPSSVPIVKPETSAQDEIPNPPAETPPDSGANVNAASEEIFDFSKKPKDPSLIQFPRIKFGGRVSSAPSLSGIAKIFTAVEDKYRSQGYVITPHNIQPDGNFLLGGEMFIVITPEFSIGARNLIGGQEGSLKIQTGTFSLKFSPDLVGSKEFRFYFSGGPSFYSFSAGVTYGPSNRISPINSFGEYTYLDSTGPIGGFDWGGSLEVGMELVGTEKDGVEFSLDLSLQGSLFPSTKLRTIDGIQEDMDFSGLVIGGGLHLCL